MKIIAIDDERAALNLLTEAIKEAVKDVEVHSFLNIKQALAYIESGGCDIAFLDVEMREMDGVSLAKRLKQIIPEVNIIFVTGYSRYMGDAFSMRASGYILKPVTTKAVKDEIENLRYPVALVENEGLFVQTFGNFELLNQNEPVHFQYNKTKELLAYLVDRKGAMCQNGELIAILWEDDEAIANKLSYLRKLKKDLVETFEAVSCNDFIVKQRGCLGIVPDKISCDYFDWLDGKLAGINAYRGEYMSQYSWAELTLGRIESQYGNKA